MACFVDVLAHGESSTVRFPEPGPDFARALRVGLSDLGVEADIALAASAVSAWMSLVGTISAEIFGHLGAGFDVVGDELVHRWAEETTARFGLT
jgi:hypothetical protein